MCCFKKKNKFSPSYQDNIRGIYLHHLHANLEHFVERSSFIFIKLFFYTHLFYTTRRLPLLHCRLCYSIAWFCFLLFVSWYYLYWAFVSINLDFKLFICGTYWLWLLTMQHESTWCFQVDHPIKWIILS